MRDTYIQMLEGMNKIEDIQIILEQMKSIKLPEDWL